MRILLLRHGHAEPKRSWPGDDLDRPLVARGRRQAKTLGKLVGNRRPDLVLSSPALRCRQTVEVLALDRGLAIEVEPALAPDGGELSLELLNRLAFGEDGLETVLVCSHREVMAVLLPALSKQSGRKLGHRLPGAKGGLWVLDFRAGRLRKVTYRAPLA